MALDAATAQQLIQKLDDDRTNYLNTLGRAHELLAQALAASATGSTPVRLTAETIRRNDRAAVGLESIPTNENFTLDDESETDDNESLFVQQLLPREEFTETGLRTHIRKHDWTEEGLVILKDIIDQHFPEKTALFGTGRWPAEEVANLPHYSIFDVGNNGAPLQIINAANFPPGSREMAVWRNIKGINVDSARERQAVGRITIVREPTPILFAALHYTMNQHFDMDEIFELLVGMHTKSLPPRPFSPDSRHRSTFVFTLEYYTIVGEGRRPMTWQLADEELEEGETHVPISRCSSVVALSLAGEPISKIRYRGRRPDKKIGDVYDPFAPWRVLSIQAHPDWRSSIDSHDSAKHYVNGPEAFLVTLRSEFKDAQKRLRDVYDGISKLVRTPSDFMFNEALRNKLLFEDDTFTYSRRYFWAYQSLAIMNEDIEEMMSAYKSTFTNSVWNGTHKFIWPGDETLSSRYAHWRKRMAGLRMEIDRELEKLQEINSMNQEKMKEIKALWNNLFNGTSVLESRRSVREAQITVQQGHNIKLLTLVTIFFLPLTFATSVFGMTNMPPNNSFHLFGIVTVAVCLPTYLLIGFVNTRSGPKWWARVTGRFFAQGLRKFATFLTHCGYSPRWMKAYVQVSGSERANTGRRNRKFRSQSASDAIAARGGFEATCTNPAVTLSLSKPPTENTPTHLIVPSNSTIRFKKSSSDLPRSPTGQAEQASPVLQNGASTGLEAPGSAPEIRSHDATQPGWFSKLLARGRVRKTKGNDVELC